MPSPKAYIDAEAHQNLQGRRTERAALPKRTAMPTRCSSADAAYRLMVFLHTREEVSGRR